MKAVVLMATPCTESLGFESGGHKHGGDEGRMLCWREKGGFVEEREGWVLLKIPRGDIDGVGEVKRP